MDVTEECPFCCSKLTVVVESECSFVIRDQFPVSDDHMLVLPKRHVLSVFDLPVEELNDLWSLVVKVREKLLNSGAEGINIGINDGTAAGQTVAHGHIHAISRYKGDIDDPRGGVRWVIPSKAAYWK